MLDVLVADDNKVIREVVMECFDKKSFRIVAEASDGLEALNMYRKCRPHIVTMDMSMPSYSGVYAIKMILDEDPDARIIIISSMDDDIIEGLRAGAVECVHKPINKNKFVEAIERAIRGLDINKPEIRVGRFIAGSTDHLRKDKKGKNENTSVDEINADDEKEFEDLSNLRMIHKYNIGLQKNLIYEHIKLKNSYVISPINGSYILTIEDKLDMMLFNKVTEVIKIFKNDSIKLKIEAGGDFVDESKLEILRFLVDS